MEKDPLTDALRYHPSSQLLSTRHLFALPKNRYVPPHFFISSCFFFPEKRLDNKLQRARVRVGAQLCLTCTGGNRCVCFRFFPFFHLRDVEASCRLLEAGESELFTGRLALLSTAILERKKGDIRPVFSPSLYSLCYISVCLCAHNKQNLLSIFTYPNNGICADKLAGEPNVPHGRFDSYRFCLCAICALKIFPLFRSHLAHFDNYFPSVIY